MTEFLSRVMTPVILIYVVSAMLALGLTQTVSQILAPLRNIRITILAVVASYIILPLGAALTARPPASPGADACSLDLACR